MSIALTCDLVVKIGKSRKMLNDRCNEQLDTLLSLGEIYSSKIENEVYYESLIKDKDFNGRSVLNIICYCKFQQLMSEDDPKAGNMIRNIWYGEDFTRCDGNIFGFSNMSHIVLTRAKRADSATPFFDIVSGGFEKNFKVDYTFQFVYRKMAISSYFMKEILFGALMILMFRSVNESYRKLFMGPLKFVSEKDGSWVFTESSGMYDFD
mmetsp:Transcript_34575/g.42585  ORF Transcript_34575/g.42585 Transcript_34575/m.42585 type:complete len:208 (+) Transcript_34575:476-1099(+)